MTAVITAAAKLTAVHLRMVTKVMAIVRIDVCCRRSHLGSAVRLAWEALAAASRAYPEFLRPEPHLISKTG